MESEEYFSMKSRQAGWELSGEIIIDRKIKTTWHTVLND